MTHGSPLTRREILAAIGGVGLLAAGPRVAGALGSDPSFTQYTYAQTSGPDLRVAWYERYNGVLQEESNLFSDGPPLTNSSDAFNQSGDAGRFVDVTGTDAVATGPVLSIPNAQPGDEGLLLIGLRAEDAAARVWLSVSAYDFAENSLVEPERAEGDTDDEGELQDYVDVECWYDTGRLGVGGCNGERDFTEEAVVAAGTLAEVSDALTGGVPLDFGLVGDACIEADTQRCLALRWRIDPAVTNVIQSDSASLDIAFAATTCDDATNPFGGER
ncbi:hypothetical protein [Haloplanus aerogenes]|uniref:Uncharacterized protein n=1 Tax=Haloplanus aerogenes TaxID=660522 RepID=A0A3M0EAA1_9EURY|nr:hypothetical protein [Haloplanus aerogenes]AZH25394.1 hypothetical protein DU502_08380 [Haloplanus aerogenes]RMB25100.1 hypothetical protein ATH50_0183 [Haloplanus aerogenes]